MEEDAIEQRGPDHAAKPGSIGRLLAVTGVSAVAGLALVALVTWALLAFMRLVAPLSAGTLLLTWISPMCPAWVFLL